MSEKPRMRIAVPSVPPGGLAAQPGGHFGRCACFTIVEIGESEALHADAVANAPHGDCSGPLELLAAHGVGTLIVNGIGARALRALRERGIAVYTGQAGTVEQLVRRFSAGELMPTDERGACRGGGHHNA